MAHKDSEKYLPEDLASQLRVGVERAVDLRLVTAEVGQNMRGQIDALAEAPSLYTVPQASDAWSASNVTEE